MEIEPFELDRTQVADEALTQVQLARERIRLGEVEEAVALVDLALAYRVEVDTLIGELQDNYVRPGHDGTPYISEFLALELSAATGTTQRSALNRVAEVLDLKYRHPALWEAFCAGLVPRWQAVKLTELTVALDVRAAHWVDEQLARKVGRVSFPRLQRIGRGLVARADPELRKRQEEDLRSARSVQFGHPEAGTTDMYATLEARDAKALDETLNRLASAMGESGDERTREQRRASALGLLADPATALDWLNGSTNGDTSTGITPAACSGSTARGHRGRTIVHVHLAAETIVDPASGVARIEGFGPLTTASLPEFLAGSNVTLRPVIDEARITPVDSYEIPERIREAVHRRHPVENFPFSSRSSRSLDLDHLKSYRHGSDWEPGQTGTHNLTPLSRRVHRAKTSGAWHVMETSTGHYAWRSPLGRKYIVDLDGTSPPPHLRRE
ncbi:hypothetical protein GCM10028820_11040 [Tessaracoccus terricola]